MRISVLFFAFCFSVVSFGAMPRTKSPAGAKVYIISPKNGEEVTSPFKVVFGLEGMGVAPANVPTQNTGHHHLMIDTEIKDFSKPLPNDANHKHFGGGQTEAMVTLPAGEHSLQLILADHLHIPHEPPVMSEKIKVKVK